MKKTNLILLIIGIILAVAGGVLCYNTYHSSYADSLACKNEISALTDQITEKKTELEVLTEDAAKASLESEITALTEQKSALSDQKLASERPYSYSLTLLFVGIILTGAGAVNLVRSKRAAALQNQAGANSRTQARAKLNKLAQASLMAALCYIGFAFFKIDIPVGTESTAFHLGNVFCVLAALLLGGFWGGLAGAVGMTVADLTTIYVTSAPKTFILKFCIGLIVGLVAHQIFHLNTRRKRGQIIGITVLASACGMIFNIIADPLVGYFYKTYLLGLPQDLTKTLLKISQLTTSVNAAVAVLCASVFYLALRPALKKAGLLT